MNRILELAKRLDELNIPYEVNCVIEENDQLRFCWCEADIICHRYSYGGDQGLFEIMGGELMTSEELERDSVVGYITMEDAVNRIKEAYERETKTEEKGAENAQ